MAKGVTGNEPDPRIVYADIIDLPHHQSKTHPHMSLYDRAAQFAPFSALTGYDDMIIEESRITDYEKTLSESVTDILSLKLNVISEAIKNGEHPIVTITYFVADTEKAGGEYITVTEAIKDIDSINNKIILQSTSGYAKMNDTIGIVNITNISGEIVDYLD